MRMARVRLHDPKPEVVSGGGAGSHSFGPSGQLPGARRRSMVTRFLGLSMALNVFFLAQPVAVSVFKRGIPLVFTVAGAVAVVPAVLAAILVLRTPGNSMTIGWRGVPMAMCLLAIALATITGIVSGNSLLLLYYDLWVFILWCAWVVVGSESYVWKWVAKSALIVFWIGYVVVVIGLMFPKPFADYGQLVFLESEGVRGLTATAGYESMKILKIWPVVFLLAVYSSRSGLRYWAGVLAFPAVLILQVLFVKRAPTAFVILIVFFGIALAIRGKYVRSRRGTVVVMMVLAATLAGLSQAEQFVSLGNRYSSESLVDSERLAEGRSVVEGWELADYVVGKGMGGTFRPPSGWSGGLVFGASGGPATRYVMHTGVLYPLLKGGIILQVAYFAVWGLTLLPRRRPWYTVAPNAAAVVIVGVYFLFQFIEGPPTHSTPMDAVVIGLACGRAFAGQSEVVVDIRAATRAGASS